MTENVWSSHVSDFYKPLIKNVESWKVCPSCGERPRLWIFDNGKTAKCCCTDRYGKPQARVESIMSYYKRNGNLENYDVGGNDLRNAWNKYTETGINQNNLQDGEW